MGLWSKSIQTINKKAEIEISRLEDQSLLILLDLMLV